MKGVAWVGRKHATRLRLLQLILILIRRKLCAVLEWHTASCLMVQLTCRLSFPKTSRCLRRCLCPRPCLSARTCVCAEGCAVSAWKGLVTKREQGGDWIRTQDIVEQDPRKVKPNDNFWQNSTFHFQNSLGAFGGEPRASPFPQDRLNVTTIPRLGHLGRLLCSLWMTMLH